MEDETKQKRERNEKLERIAVSGASGFIGSGLCGYFERQGVEVVRLSRGLFEAGKEDALQSALESCEAVIHLAGAPIQKWWSSKYRDELYSSRILTTRRLVKAIRALSVKPSVVVSASAIGFYKSDNRVYTEYSGLKGSGFLSDLCEAWEFEARKLPPEVRLVRARFGMVLSSKGGALPRMMLPFRLGVGVSFGSGSQNVSWIHVSDLQSAMAFVLSRRDVCGPVNFTAPGVLAHRDFARALGKKMKVFRVFSVPGPVLSFFMGEASSVVLEGQGVHPGKLLHHGFEFQFPRIEEALEDILHDPGVKS